MFNAHGPSFQIFTEPSAATVAALEASLDDWFAKKRRGRATKVFIYHKADGVWFLVRHGEPFTRESIIEDGEGVSGSVFYRPEKYDVLVYNPSNGELRMNARTVGERKLYRIQLGLHFFGDADFFDGHSQFTLEPLRTLGADALLCDDVDGMEWVRLKELHIVRGGTHKAIEIHKAEDVFAALQEHDRSIPTTGQLSKASFLIQFADAATPRTATISAHNRAQFKRDEDADILEAWLTRRGFMIVDTERHGE